MRGTAELLLGDMTAEQQVAIRSTAHRQLVVAGAGSGKTEVIARRIAWWVGVGEVAKDSIVAFTFTEKAAEEMKFRVRKYIDRITPPGRDATLGGMFVGTIHGFCLQMLQELAPQEYGMFDILDDSGRIALVQRGFRFPLGLNNLQDALGVGQFETINQFLRGYDLLNEHALLRVSGLSFPRPTVGVGESEWIEAATLSTDVGTSEVNQAFAVSAARYYANLQARRLLDFSTSQAEMVQLVAENDRNREDLAARFTHLVVDEFQDINPVQDQLIRRILGDEGHLTAVGDHRQAIYGWRGGRVELMAGWRAELDGSDSGEALGLPDNFRSTSRIVDLANAWATSITPLGTLGTPTMVHQRSSRDDWHESHVSIRHFADRDEEAEWITSTIQVMVEGRSGIPHDVGEDEVRGIGLSDIAVLVRSATHIRVLMDELERAGVPAVVRAGPDLFRRPEVLLMLGALGLASGTGPFYGRPDNPRSIAGIAADTLSCGPDPVEIIRAAAVSLRASGLEPTGAGDSLIAAATAVSQRVRGDAVDRELVAQISTPELKTWLLGGAPLRRIYPQTLYHWLAAEAGVPMWDATDSTFSATAMFHLGQLSTLITGIETPGWVRPADFKWQVIALTNWGARQARSQEAPLMVAPDAVTISTIHSAKGLEFPVVFLADVNASKFPSNQARRQEAIPIGGEALLTINPDTLADNPNYDAERRLMYVALTRAERYLFISSSGRSRSRFKRELDDHVANVGGEVAPSSAPQFGARQETRSSPSFRLVTSFSDLRYYLECPHDYYLRKVLGFAPPIDQAFGYGRGVHNLMRAIHLSPAEFAALAHDRSELGAEIDRMIDEGLFYLRYTVGEPYDNMRAKAREIVSEYVVHYRSELGSLEFEAERAFETLIEEAGVLVGGAIDVVRHDDPPRVALIDFKSGDPEKRGENASALDLELMQLQVTLYGLAAKKELEYEPDLGLVRYLGVEDGTPDGERELSVPLDDDSLAFARRTVVDVARDIQARNWREGPRRPPKKPGNSVRCQECDFFRICGLEEAVAARRLD